MVSLDDPEAIPGISIKKVIESFLNSLSTRYVFLIDVEGAGSYNMLQDEEFPLLPISKLLDYLPQVSQFNWVDFYFLKTFITEYEDFLKLDHYEKIAASETTVRAIDQSYIYVYTPYKEVAERVKTCGFKIDSIKEGELTSLDYPF